MGRVPVHLIGCTVCGKVSQDHANMKRHVLNKTCSENGAMLHKFTVDVDVDWSPLMQQQQQQPLICGGRRRAVPSEVMRGRLPSRDGGDDDRIDLLFSLPSSYIKELLKMPTEDVPAFLFETLWGVDAPKKFWSMCRTREGMVEVEESNDDEEEGGGAAVKCSQPHPLTREYLVDVVEYLLEFADAVFRASVPVRHKEDSLAAQMAASRLALERPAKVDAAVKKLRISIKSKAPTLLNL